MHQRPHEARQKSWIAFADFALPLSVANGFLQNSEIPAAPYLCGASAASLASK
jgi:hypothetical protein